MKLELGFEIMMEFPVLRPKTYSYSKDDRDNKKQTLHEKCPNTELFLVGIFLYSD